MLSARDRQELVGNARFSELVGLDATILRFDQYYAKRGGGNERVTLFEAASVFEERAEDLLELDEALSRLAEIDADKCRIVELRFFAGLDVAETAEALEVSTSTVERGWRFARAWLKKEIEDSS